MPDPKPTRIVYARPPRKRPAPAVRAVLTGSCIVTTTTPGEQRQTTVDSPDDPKADARVKAFFARMIRPRGERFD
jgi:hypothetical protein